MRRVKLAMAAAVIVGSSSPAVATMAARMSRQQIVRTAARIVHGTVVEVRSGRDDSGTPATWTTLDVAHAVKGAAPGRVTIKQVGVTAALPDGAFLQIAGLPRYRVGEEVVLFLRGESAAGRARVASLSARRSRSGRNRTGAWLLVLDSWGGFTGHGKGGVTIASDGKVFAHRLGRRANKNCRTRLTEVELQALTRAVSAAAPSTWSASYEPADERACCDRFTWSLRLHHREADAPERVTHTGWHDASEGLPRDLLAVATIARSVMKSVLTSCTM